LSATLHPWPPDIVADATVHLDHHFAFTVVRSARKRTKTRRKFLDLRCSAPEDATPPEPSIQIYYRGKAFAKFV